MRGLILAAGTGSRLRPLTDEVPKCMVPLNGRPLLEYSLESVGKVGIREAVLVVGHMQDRIRAHFGDEHAGVRISYVFNEDYATTNNLYSLWLAREELDDDILLLEADLRFDRGILEELVETARPDVAVVDPYREHMDGTVIQARGDLAETFVLKANQGEGFDYGTALKTVNIYRLSRDTMRSHFLPVLDEYVTNARTGSYYEAVLADLVSEGRLELGVLRVGDRPWAEIDTVEDLRLAEALFGA